MAIIKTLTENDNSIKYFADKIKANFVKKDGNKQLSDENYTLQEKQKLQGLSDYTLPIADENTLGGVKIGEGINKAPDGTISVTSGGGGSGGTITTVDISNDFFELKENQTIGEMSCYLTLSGNIVSGKILINIKGQHDFSMGNHLTLGKIKNKYVPVHSIWEHIMYRIKPFDSWTEGVDDVGSYSINNEGYFYIDVIKNNEWAIGTGHLFVVDIVYAVKNTSSGGGGGVGTSLTTDEEDTTNVDNKIKFADREYDPYGFSGLGRKILRKNIQGGKNILTQDKINRENTVYIIRYDYDLNNTLINIPNNVTLKFEGGSFKNGTIKGYNITIEANYPVFDDTITIIPNSLKDNILDLQWFKMYKWTAPEYIANHKNASAVIPDINNTIVNKHLQYNLLVPIGIYPFNDHIKILEKYNIHGQQFNSGGTLNIIGKGDNSDVGAYTRSAFIFPKGKGFYWFKGSIDCNSSKVKNMYFEAKDNIFHLWGQFTHIENITDRTPDAFHNGLFENIELYSQEGNGFYSPSNYVSYIFQNTYKKIKCRVTTEGKGFFYGMCTLGNEYIDISDLFYDLSGIKFTEKNFAAFVNMSAYVTNANLDDDKYVLYYKATQESNPYEDQACRFFADKCNFERIENNIVYTEGVYVSMEIDIRRSAMQYQNVFQGVLCECSRVRSFAIYNNYFGNVGNDKILKVNKSYDRPNIETDIDLLVTYADDASGTNKVLVPRGNKIGKWTSNKNFDYSYLTTVGWVNPQYYKVLDVDYLKTGLTLKEVQTIKDTDDINNNANLLKSDSLIFEKTVPYTLNLFLAGVNQLTWKAFAGKIFRIMNHGAPLTINTDKGSVVIPKGIYIDVKYVLNKFEIVESSQKKYPTIENFPIVYEGDLIAQDENNIFMVKRGNGSIFIPSSYKRNKLGNYESHREGQDFFDQRSKNSNTIIEDNKVYWCIQSGTTSNQETITFNNATLGAETVDGNVKWMYMGEAPEVVKINTVGGGSSNIQTKVITLNLQSHTGTTITVPCEGVTNTNTIIVAPEPASQKNYMDMGLYAAAQLQGNIIFNKKAQAFDTPIKVNVLISN